MKGTEFTPERIKALRAQLGLSQSKLPLLWGTPLPPSDIGSKAAAHLTARPRNHYESRRNTPN